MSFLAVTLSQFWLTVQGSLFPWLGTELGELSEKQKQLVAILELLVLESFISPSQGNTGRPTEDRRAIGRAYVAKAVYNLVTTRQLLERLASDPSMRRLCGWERASAVPSEATFSRAFAEFTKNELPERVHAALIEKYEKARLVGHISRDATSIEGRERAAKKVKKVKELAKPKGGRRKKGEAPSKPPTRRACAYSSSASQHLAPPKMVTIRS